MDCFNCKNECRPQQYRIKIINETGEVIIKNVCSVKCGNEIKNKYYNIHNNRANEMLNQECQRLK
jgi:hypothetical protein